MNKFFNFHGFFKIFFKYLFIYDI